MRRPPRPPPRDVPLRASWDMCVTHENPGAVTHLPPTLAGRRGWGPSSARGGCRGSAVDTQASPLTRGSALAAMQGSVMPPLCKCRPASLQTMAHRIPAGVNWFGFGQ